MADDARTAARLREGLQLVSRVVEAFAENTADYPRLLEAIARSVAENFPDTCSVVLRDDAGMFTPVAVHDADPAVVTRLREALRRQHASAEVPLIDAALVHGHVFLPRIDLDALRAEHSPQIVIARLALIGARGLIIVPIASRGIVHGVLVLCRRRAELPPLDEIDLEIAKNIAHHAALAISNAQLFARLEHTEALRAAEARAVEASQLLDAIVENIPDMVFVKEATKLSFVRFNRAGEELLGMQRTALIGKSDFDLFAHSEAAFFVAKDRETLAAQALVEIPEEPIETLTGRRWLHTKKVPLMGDDGMPRYLLGISRDITERKRATEELRDAKDAAERASHELEAFSYSVAHDLRAPLRAVDGFSQALIEDYGDKLDDVGRRYLSRVRVGAQHMAGLIDDLLALSRVTRAELQRERVDLSAIAAETAAELRRAEPTREVEVVIEPGLVVQADRKMIAIAFTNLFDNAWKFTAKCARPRIELGATEIAGERTFFVRDNGAGFDMKYVDKLFGVFQRLHAEAEYPGTGIGLVTVARIVERHRGRVWAEGETGRGASFYFTLKDTKHG